MTKTPIFAAGPQASGLAAQRCTEAAQPNGPNQILSMRSRHDG